MREVLFRTVHGSRLYGLAHEGSDYDFYSVVTKVPHARARWAKQNVGESDEVTLDLGTWLLLCEKGVPQALEAMFSTCATEDRLASLRNGYRVGTGVWKTYQRTMANFATHPDTKQRRHAVRLALNLRDLREFGRFDPTLTPEQRDFVFGIEAETGQALADWLMNFAFAA